MRSKIPIGDLTDVTADRPPTIRYADFSDDGVYTIKWPEGHTTTTILSNPKFEVLAELAVEAFCDGYHREAVLTGASALDGYLDFQIEVLMRSANAKKEDILAFLKLISKQAERRLGAFLAIETALRKNAPTYIQQRMVELRNDIVHKGYIPREQEAFAYIGHVFDFVVARYAPLCAGHSDIIHKLYFEKVAALPPPSTPNRSHASVGMTTVVSFLAFRQGGDNSTLVDYVERIRRKKTNPSRGSG